MPRKKWFVMDEELGFDKELTRAIKRVVNAVRGVDSWSAIDGHGRYSVGPGKFEPLVKALAALEKYEKKN